MSKKRCLPINGFNVKSPLAKMISLIIILALIAACTTALKWEEHDSPSRRGYPGNHWHKSSTPEQLGWASEKLELAHAYSKRIGSAAVMIVDNGIVVAAWGEISRKFKCHSVRKSLMSALIGIHVDRGDINLSKTIETLGVDDTPPSLTQAEKQATVGDLIKARSGIYHPALGEAGSMKALRPKRHSHEPGSYWYYNNWDFNALGTIFEKETNTQICTAFNDLIARNLQMEDFNTDDCRILSGQEMNETPVSRHPYYFFRMSARDLARFGLLYLREGRWQNHRILSAEWIKQSTASHSKRGQNGGYGYMWWTGVHDGLLPNVTVSGHSYHASGWGGQKVIVLPYRKLVIVHRANTDWPGNHVGIHQIGRLLWLILSAAGEKEIGSDPSIEASQGNRLTNEDLNQLFAQDFHLTGPNNGIFPGGESIQISCTKSGKLILSIGEDVDISGKWWVSRNRFYYRILGLKSYFTINRRGSSFELFDDTGTLFGKFQPV